MNFLEHLIGLLREFWERIAPFTIVPEYEGGVVLRLGVFNRMAKKGLNWKLFFLEEIFTCRTTTTTLNVKPQTLTTKDGKNIVVSSIVKYRIVEPKTFILEVEGAVDAIADISQGVVKQMVLERNMSELVTNDLDNDIQKKVRSQAKRWGIEVDLFTITELSQVRSIRLLQ